MGTGRRYSNGGRGPMLCGGACILLLCWFLFFGRSSASATSDKRCDIGAYDPSTTTELDLKKCALKQLPVSIAKFTKLTKLDLGNNNLRNLPPLPPSLLTLFCLGNEFETIPPTVAALPQLRMLSFKSCRLRDIGASPLPTSLVWLILTDNELRTLPESLGALTGMRKLMLANNKLVSLPPSMAAMRDVELLRLANNKLGEIPRWVLELPRLSWLAIAGNPCVAPAPARASLPSVRYEDLVFGDKLGEGTSSIVRKGTWRGAAGQGSGQGSAVALKVYKAALSSDGKNIDEVRASCAVDHANVQRWLGYYEVGAAAAARASSAAADWKLIGVLEFVSGFSSLGKPPSMATITRDTYPPATRFTGSEILAIAIGIASAMEHLHSVGLSHGDLYAHNILWKRDGDASGIVEAAAAHRGGGGHHGGGGGASASGAPPAAIAKLSDFGAAFYYGAGSADAKLYERMEQRAFGLLLEELLERHDGSEPHHLPTVNAAARLAAAENPADRPGFRALVHTLAEHGGGGGGGGGGKGRGLRPRSTFGRVLPRDHPHHHGM